MKLYKANIIFTREKDRFEVIPHGYVGVEDGRVVAVANHADAFDKEAEEVIDYGDCLLIPAMNDMHVHAPQYRNQGISMDLELLPWLNQYTFPEEARYSDSLYAQRMYSRFVHDLWRYGTMRAVAFATTHLQSTRVLMELFREAGMGAFVGKVDMDRNAIDALHESVDDAVAKNEALINEWNDPDGLVKPIITPRFIPSCSPAMLRACGELARKYHMPVQSHLSENAGEIVWVRELEPQSHNYGDAYDRYGLFGQTPTVMAHCVYTAGDELELMARRGVMVAHCPTSNLNVSSGIAPVRTFLDRGVKVGLGSDISGGHDLSVLRARQEQTVSHPLRSLLDCHQVGRQLLRPRGQLRARLRVRCPRHRRPCPQPRQLLAAASPRALHLPGRRPPHRRALLPWPRDSRAQCC